jgi:hypothetical protein
VRSWTVSLRTVARVWMVAAFVSTVVNRVVLIGLWAYTDVLTLAFASGWVGGVGFVVAPWSTLTYAVMATAAQPTGVQGFEWVLVGFAALLDATWYRDFLPPGWLVRVNKRLVKEESESHGG